MENNIRSQRTRDAALQAALTIITRDGASRLTIDAIARESGISKGGVLHQFRTKEAVLKALMEYQVEQSRVIFQEYLAEIPRSAAEPVLQAQIATLQKAADHPESTAFALAGVMGENPEFLAAIRQIEAGRVASIKQEAADPNLAIVRWAAAKGLALAAILGLCPLTGGEREQVFEFLRDNAQWETLAAKQASLADQQSG